MYLPPSTHDRRGALLIGPSSPGERLTFAVADASSPRARRAVRSPTRAVASDPRDVFVVRSGPDMARFRPVPAYSVLKHGGRFLVGYVGVMGAQEGIDHIIRAARSIHDEMGRDDVSFVLMATARRARPEEAGERARHLGLRALHLPNP